jgi:hypothetical protein
MDTLIDHRTLTARVPELYHDVDAINTVSELRLPKLHEPLLDNCARVVSVHRHYRQTLVSNWLVCRRLRPCGPCLLQRTHSRPPWNPA